MNLNKQQVINVLTNVYKKVRKEINFIEVIDISTQSSLDVSEVLICHIFFSEKEKTHCS